VSPPLRTCARLAQVRFGAHAHHRDEEDNTCLAQPLNVRTPGLTWIALVDPRVAPRFRPTRSIPGQSVRDAGTQATGQATTAPWPAIGFTTGGITPSNWQGWRACAPTHYRGHISATGPVVIAGSCTSRRTRSPTDRRRHLLGAVEAGAAQRDARRTGCEPRLCILEWAPLPRKRPTRTFWRWTRRRHTMWDQRSAPKDRVSIPMAPIADNGLVFVGTPEGTTWRDGSCICARRGDGHVVWQFDVVPANGAARATWTDSALPITGARSGHRSPSTRAAAFCTCLPGSARLRYRRRTGANLYTNSVIALDGRRVACSPTTNW